MEQIKSELRLKELLFGIYLKAGSQNMEKQNAIINRVIMLEEKEKKISEELKEFHNESDHLSEQLKIIHDEGRQLKRRINSLKELLESEKIIKNKSIKKIIEK